MQLLFSSNPCKEKRMWCLLQHHLVPRLLFLILHTQVIFTSSSESASSSSPHLCSPEERTALLHFKHSVSIDSSASGFCGEYPKTKSWNESIDCCSWDGVTCDKFTGHVIGLDLSSSWLLGVVHSNSSLFLLRHLQKLNLSCNDFSGYEISPKFGQFTELTHLDLSSTNFCGLIPTEFFQLSKLVSLDLSDNSVCEDRSLELPPHGFSKFMQNLTELRFLHLDSVNMSSVAPGSLVNLSSSLISLSLSYSSMQGEFPNRIFHLPFLQKLSLSWNDFSGNLPKSNWSSPLRILELSFNLFSGMLPDAIGNLIYLNELDLSHCEFRGLIPTSLWNLTGLTSLNLGSNNFSGEVSALLSNLRKLNTLDLSGNNFSGQFPDVFGNLSDLIGAYLSENNFSGQVPSSALYHVQLSDLDFSENQLQGQIPIQISGLSNLTGRIPALGYLDLRNNKLTGPIPNSIFELVNLAYLLLSSNNLSGILNPKIFSKLKNLVLIELSNNNLLSLRISDNVNFTLPKLMHFRFSSCNLTQFPIFLRNSKTLKTLDLSNNRIPGRVSKWEFANWQSLAYLDLSSNFLTSFEHISLMVNLQVLNLNSNMLNGSLVVLPTTIMQFSVSNNQLTGLIPESFCNLSSIEHLDLSNNSFIGTIPQCLKNNNMLSFLDFGINSFYGSIPPFGDSPIQYLSLQGNQFEGPLPSSLANSSELKVLDVGNNMINDTFPHWLATLPKLQVVVLRNNRFHGPIGNSSTRFPFCKLQILDLSQNQFIGLLPTVYFENFKAMMHGDNSSDEVDYLRELTGEYTGLRSFGYYSMTLTVKGVNMEMARVLTIFTAMDLSNNKFQGPIPEIVGKFNSLELLNFSHNDLRGHIPPILGNLTKLESLDLSSNKLVGEIPEELTSLTSLAVLNLSYNQLVGPIPQGPQFNTFQNDSYVGNLGLCGFPLSEKCSNDDTPEPTPATFNEEDNNFHWFDWKIVMMGYGCGLVIGLSIGCIAFVTRKPLWLIRMVERKRPSKVTRLNIRPGGGRNQ